MSAEIGVGADAPGLGSFLNRWARGPRAPFRPFGPFQRHTETPPGSARRLEPSWGPAALGARGVVRPPRSEDAAPARLLGPTAVPPWEKV